MPRGGPSSQRAGRDQGTHGPGIGHPDPDSAAPSLSPASRQVCKVEGQSRGGGCLLNTSPGLDPCKPPRSVLGKNFPGVTCLSKAVTAACHLQNQRQPPGCFQSNRASAPPMGAAGLCHCVLAPLWGQVPLKTEPAEGCRQQEDAPVSTHRGCSSPEAPAGQGPSPRGARTSCTAWRRDCSPSRICSTCSDSSITCREGGRGQSGAGTCQQQAHPTWPLTHRLPKLVQRVCVPHLAGPKGDSEQAILCGQ